MSANYIDFVCQSSILAKYSVHSVCMCVPAGENLPGHTRACQRTSSVIRDCVTAACFPLGHQYPGHVTKLGSLALFP